MTLTSKIVQTLSGQTIRPAPIWMMRQAGRHLPEYMKVRETTKTFIDFCLSPKKAADVTLQPVDRYDMDAAILFADILLIPLAMGRRVDFIKGQGPDLDPITISDISNLDQTLEPISNVFETVRLVREELAQDKALIGFCGGPWTVATYMIEGKGTPNKETSKRFAYEEPAAMSDLLNQIACLSADYLIEQAKAGADVLKVFESWAEGLSPDLFDCLVIRPTQTLINRVRAAGVTVPIIGFPRGAGLNLLRYADTIETNAVALGTDVHIPTFHEKMNRPIVTQGNLDPLVLRIGGKPLEDAVERLLQDIVGPHIINLGHGVSPDVKIENVHAVIDHVRTGQGHYI